MLNEFTTHTTIATTNALCFCFDQSTGGPVQGINALLVCQVACFKKDGQDLEEVQKLELKGLSLV